MAAKISSIFSSKATRSAGVCLAALALLNVAVGVAPAWWIDGHENSINQVLELEQRVARYPHPEKVRVLVLGNSHAMTGLRPPVVAAALGLDPYAVFSLAVPASNPQEGRLLIKRYAAHFPQARLVIGNVDVAYLNQQQEARLRYMTRHAPLERWRMAMGEPNIDARLGLLVGLFTPLFDFKESLRKRLEASQMEAERFRHGNKPLPEAQRRHIADMDYPWGYPIPNDNPALFTPIDRFRLQGTSELLQRTLALTETPWRIESHGQELSALKSDIEARGMRLVLTELPISRRLANAFEVRVRHVVRRYRETLAGWSAREGVQVVKGLSLPDDAHYYDGDHLNAEGAASVAASLAAEAGLGELLER